MEGHYTVNLGELGAYFEPSSSSERSGGDGSFDDFFYISSLGGRFAGQLTRAQLVALRDGINAYLSDPYNRLVGEPNPIQNQSEPDLELEFKF